MHKYYIKTRTFMHSHSPTIHADDDVIKELIFVPWIRGKTSVISVSSPSTKMESSLAQRLFRSNLATVINKTTDKSALANIIIEEIQKFVMKTSIIGLKDINLHQWII